MDQIKAGTVVAFARNSFDISAAKHYTVQEDPKYGLFIEDDGGAARYACVQSADNYQSKGGYIVQHPADPASDTRTALIEALKARLTEIKDGERGTPESREQVWICNTLEAAYSIQSKVVPGPSTVTFTEPANNP